jgi:hypothetical protein
MIAPVPLEQLAAEENRTLSENIAALPDAYRFANNAVALLSNGITHYPAAHKAFGAYLSQVNINMCLALMSALRQHETQTYSMLRHALEHIALAAYALSHPDSETGLDRYFTETGEDQIDAKKLMTDTVYPWIKRTYPTQSAVLHSLKTWVSKRHGHASLMHAYKNIQSLDDAKATMTTSYIEWHDPVSIEANLIHIGQVALLGVMLIGEVDYTDKKLHFAPDLKDETVALMKDSVRLAEQPRVQPGGSATEGAKG